jgi:hypothetical protein
MSKRTRITTTVSEADYIPRRRHKKNAKSIVVVALFVLLGWFLISRTRSPGVPLPVVTHGQR